MVLSASGFASTSLARSRHSSFGQIFAFAVGASRPDIRGRSTRRNAGRPARRWSQFSPACGTSLTGAAEVRRKPYRTTFSASVASSATATSAA